MPSVRRALALLLLSGLSTCGGSSNPAAPSGPAQIAGVYTGRVTPMTITGGECVGVQKQSAVGTSARVFVGIQQSGSSLLATVLGDGIDCTYSGSVGITTMSLTLQSCQVPADVSIKCGNGAIRDIQIVAGAFTGTVIDTRIEGTEDETWNTFVSGTTTATGPMVINGKFDIYRH